MPTPARPRWPFPKETILTAAANGQWCKKHRGKFYYFGVWNDPQGALEKWRREWPSITGAQARPQRETQTHCSLGIAVNNYLAARLAEHRRQELEWSTFTDLKGTSRRIINALTGDRMVHSLAPVDFDRLLHSVAHLTPISRQKFVYQTRAIFEWIGQHMGIAVEMGGNFTAPPRRAIRKQLNERDQKIFEPSQIHKLMEMASPQMKAMMLLGINGGFGNRDTSELPTDAVNLDGAIIDFYRHKTQARRVVPLWPETVAALRAVIVPGQERLFLDRFGKPVERRGVYGICRMMAEIAEASSIPCTFYWFRYTFATIASQIPDDHARHLIMGHVIDGVSENYVLKFPVDRLRRLTEHVHDWLYNFKSGSRS